MSKISKFKVGVAKSSEVSIPSEIDFKDKPNMALLAQAWRVYFDREHTGLSKTLTRSQISRTTKKWYRQKGTGNARHGARSAPIFVGGSKAHGPKGEKRVLALPKKMTRKALESALLLKIKEEKLVLVEGIKNIKKTKEAAELLKNISEKDLVLMVLSKDNQEKRIYFRNIERVKIVNFESLNAKDVIRAGVVLFDMDIFVKAVRKTRKEKPDKS